MNIAHQLARAHANIEISTKAREFVNLARCIAMGRGDHYRVQQVAHDQPTLRYGCSDTGR